MFHNRLGLSGLLKEGSRSFSSTDGAVIRNIEACKQLSQLTQTSLGPFSMNKLVVNHINKRYVTSDAYTIVENSSVNHPAANMCVMAMNRQQHEWGDGSTFVMVLIGELLDKAEYLLKQGLHSSDVIKGYEIAAIKCQEYLTSLVSWNVNDVRSAEELEKGIKTSVASKSLASATDIAKLLSDAAVMILPPNPRDIAVDNIRVAKLTGGNPMDSSFMNGMIISREPSGHVTHKIKPKVMVLGCGLELAATEAKGTVLLKSAEELLNFTKGDENKMDEIISSIKNAGTDAIVVHGGAVSDIGLHYCNKYDILVLKIQSKFETRRLCRSLGATAMVRLGAPTAEELGVADIIETIEISSKKVTRIVARDTRVSTIILRGATTNVLDETERAVDDGVNCLKALCNDSRFVTGAGATEIELAAKMQAFGATISGVDQFAVLKFGEAFECIPTILAQTCGSNATDAVTALYHAHQNGNRNEGVNVEGPPYTLDAFAAGILDHYKTKASAINLAVDAALTILRVDQIIMAKPAGGPAPRNPQAPDLDD